MPERFRAGRHVLASFWAVMLVLSAALVWLGWRLLEQDRSLERQRSLERLEYVSDQVVSALERGLAEIEDLIRTSPASSGALPPGVFLVDARTDGLDTYPPSRLLYSPHAPKTAEPGAGVFAEGEALEYRQNAPARAITEYQRLAGSRDPAVRAGALIRLGRTLRKTRRTAEALEAYAQLERLNPVRVAGTPAGLLAREARCRLLEETGRRGELEREARNLYGDLQTGRWQLSRDDYEYHTAETLGWMKGGKIGTGWGVRGGTPAPVPDFQDRLAEAAAVEWLWRQWAQRPGRGRRLLRIEDQPVLLVWTASADRLAAALAGRRYLEALVQRAAGPQGVRIALVDGDGRLLLGQLDGAARPQALRTAGATGMPWTVHVAGASPQAERTQFTARRHFLWAGFGVMALLLACGTYFISRAISRELAAARLQSDFVSAVSHEFRTPLTAVRQLSELLVKDRLTSEEERRESYELLAREGERLDRLVEELLDFGRMEAGALEYRFESLDPVPLVRDLVAEFQENAAARGHRIETAVQADCPPVRADGKALARALWNLLDNATKYSPECPTVWVGLALQGKRLAVSVRDQGIGIPLEEQRKIFRKFARASNVKARALKGTGIGLAMARHIVRAHGGDIRLASEPGRGSTFTILLPVEAGV